MFTCCWLNTTTRWSVQKRVYLLLTPERVRVNCCLLLWSCCSFFLMLSCCCVIVFWCSVIVCWWIVVCWLDVWCSLVISVVSWITIERIKERRNIDCYLGIEEDSGGAEDMCIYFDSRSNRRARAELAHLELEKRNSLIYDVYQRIRNIDVNM